MTSAKNPPESKAKPKPEAPYERLERARVRAGFKSAADFARKADVPEVTYRSHENGTRALTISAARQYAPHLKCEWAWLMFGTANLESATGGLPGVIPLTTVHVRGKVEAGDWQEAMEWPYEDWYPISAPVDERYRQVQRFALEVRGPSMDRIYPDGSTVICVRFEELARDPKSGERVVCQRVNGRGAVEATVKEFVVDANGDAWLWPRSHNPNHQQPFLLSRGTDGNGAKRRAPGETPAPSDGRRKPPAPGEQFELVALVIGSYRKE